MTVDLVAFLTARLDEDEQTAKSARPGPWRWDMSGGRFDGEPSPAGANEWGHSGPDLVDSAGVQVLTSTGYDADNVIVSRPDAEHITRHDPAWVLADVAAKRRILELHGVERLTDPPRDEDDVLCTECGTLARDEKPVPWPCPTLRLLALPFADHPDYRDEWKP